MPKYTWYGIDLQGSSCRGVMYVYSQKQLQEQLLHQDVALLSSFVQLPWLPFRRPSADVIISFFYTLATLLQAGFFLDDALTLLQKKQRHKGFQVLIHDIQCALHDGISFAQILASYRSVFGPCVIELIASGEQVDQLHQALELVSGYYTQQVEFARRVKGVVLVPAVTFGFFILVAVIILSYIVPVFASMFLAAQKEVPLVTRVLLQLSGWCTSTFLATVCCMLVILIYGAKKFFQNIRVKKIKDNYVLKIPFLGPFLYRLTVYQFLQTTAMLVRGGLHEVVALQFACAGINNFQLKKTLGAVVKKVQNGSTFADSLSESGVIIVPEVQALLSVGEESGTFAKALERGARCYKKEIEDFLHIISSLVQPGLMLILGLFIAALIFAVYMPVLQLSHVIT